MTRLDFVRRPISRAMRAISPFVRRFWGRRYFWRR
jgi:hypothetical protein